MTRWPQPTSSPASPFADLFGAGDHLRYLDAYSDIDLAAWLRGLTDPDSGAGTRR